MMFCGTSSAFGFSVVDYVKSYNLGLNLIGAAEFARVSYDSTAPSSQGKSNCEAQASSSSCTVAAQSGGRSKTLGGVGFFVEHPFEQKGQNFFWQADLSFALQILDGQYIKPANGDLDDTLQSLSYSLRGFQVKPYVRVGWTPNGLPDLILTAGPVGTLLAGTVTINDQKEKVSFLQRSKVSLFKAAHVTFEAVFLRHGDGAFSLYWSQSRAESSAAAGSFYNGDVGEMSNFSASFVHKEVGFKWLLNWP
ncbi:MAG: hypothetical protein WCI18_14575 [Pseudomonadota bacterium]